jgi:hypothetical protein
LVFIYILSLSRCALLVNGGVQSSGDNVTKTPCRVDGARLVRYGERK